MSRTDRRGGFHPDPGAAPASTADSPAAGNYTFRPLATADTDAVIRLVLAGRAADGQHEPVTPDEIRHQWFKHPGVQSRDTIAAFDADGQLVGAAAAVARERPKPGSTSPARVFLPGIVHPAYRRRGIGTHLLRASEARARELLTDVPPGNPRSLVADSPAGAAGRAAFLDTHGYRASRTFATMRRDLVNLPTPGPLPHGLRATTWVEERNEQTRIAHNDAFRDHWGSDPLTPERWRYYVGGAPGFSPACSWLALDGDTVAGYTLCALNDAPDGTRFGWFGTIGVRQASRGVGADRPVARHNGSRRRHGGRSRRGRGEFHGRDAPVQRPRLPDDGRIDRVRQGLRRLNRHWPWATGIGNKEAGCAR